MAKTIKFNLICDNKPVRTIDDLQNNFSIEDMLAYYENGLLLRWLKVRGYMEEYDQVAKISSTNAIEIIKELITIFHMKSDEEKIEESIYMLSYLNERKELCAIYNAQNYQMKKILDDYEVGYSQLVDDILQNPDDIARIKADITEMIENYSYLFKLNHRELFYILLQKSYLAVMCLMMNEQARKYYLPIIFLDEAGTEINDLEVNRDKVDMYKELCNLLTVKDFKGKLEKYIISFSGETEGYWKDLETKGKKYMILAMHSGDFVRSAGKIGGDLSYDDILNQFVILDGIDYKSNNKTHQLLYMEV